MNVLCNLLILVLESSGLVGILAGHEKGKLLEHGLNCLKYYTVLSNLMAWLVAVINLGFLFAYGNNVPFPAWLASLNLMAAVSVGLTMFTVLFYLGKLYGYREMLKGPNLHLHLLAPLAMIAWFLFSRNLLSMPFAETLAAVVPTVLYGIGYLANILKNGVKKGNHTNDWYGFAAAGLKTLPFVFMIMLGSTWVIAFALWKLRF